MIWEFIKFAFFMSDDNTGKIIAGICWAVALWIFVILQGGTL